MSKRPPDPAELEVRVDLDLPGETGRQARVFAIWIACLALAVVVAAIVGRVEHGGTLDPAPSDLALSRARRLKVAALFALLLPGLLTFGLSRHYRRGGRHARGIVVDVTAGGELRVWGRGYGARVTLAGAEVKERLVDVYAGRLGAWKQRRLFVRGMTGAGAGTRHIELATRAVAADLDAGLHAGGGEGDCVELGREDFEALRSRVLALVEEPRA